jgi:hypothetical protein
LLNLLDGLSTQPEIDCTVLLILAAIQRGAPWIYEGDLGQAWFVASSGNHGLSFPLIPAAWEQEFNGIVSVTSCYFDGTSTDFANQGTYATPGAWFNLSEDIPPLPNTLVYGGTSYSAPLISVIMAVRNLDTISLPGEIGNNVNCQDHTQ